MRMPSAIPPTFAASTDFTGAVRGFCTFLKGHGFTIGVAETLDALRVARSELLHTPDRFRTALRALLCISPDECRRFDALFDAYWLGRTTDGNAPPAPRRRRQRPPITERAAPLLMALQQMAAPPEDEGKTSSGASTAHRLRQVDFARVPAPEQEQLEALAEQLFRRLHVRLSRREKAARRGRRIDLRRTIRRNLDRGGELVTLRYRRRQPDRPRLVALLDVSGSMDRYSYFLLRFLHALQQHFRRVDSFVFSTELTCITELLRQPTLPDSLRQLSETPTPWSSGTRIGACLEAFVAHYGRRLLSRRTLVLILSDGLDTGDPALLAHALQAIRARCRRIIWLNPLMGMDGYAPLARGMQTALPYLDVFHPAHNLDSLLRLEQHLRHV